jgi:GNAT superfamily N-acetyltransferase
MSIKSIVFIDIKRAPLSLAQVWLRSAEPSIDHPSNRDAPMEIRIATAGDARAMSDVLTAIIRATGRARPSDQAFVLSTYIGNPAGIRCSVAIDAAGDIMGFQSLIRAYADNPYGVTPGWGIIGTHIDPASHRKGVGTALFTASLAAARKAGLPRIVASIGRSNAGALQYYEAVGFRTYREEDDTVHKVLLVDAAG